MVKQAIPKARCRNIDPKWMEQFNRVIQILNTTREVSKINTEEHIWLMQQSKYFTAGELEEDKYIMLEYLSPGIVYGNLSRSLNKSYKYGTKFILSNAEYQQIANKIDRTNDKVGTLDSNNSHRTPMKANITKLSDLTPNDITYLSSLGIKNIDDLYNIFYIYAMTGKDEYKKKVLTIYNLFGVQQLKIDSINNLEGKYGKSKNLLYRVYYENLSNSIGIGALKLASIMHKTPSQSITYALRTAVILKTFWNVISLVLNEQQREIIYKMYLDNRPLTSLQLAKYLNVPVETVDCNCSQAKYKLIDLYNSGVLSHSSLGDLKSLPGFTFDDAINVVKIIRQIHYPDIKALNSDLILLLRLGLIGYKESSSDINRLVESLHKIDDTSQFMSILCELKNTKDISLCGFSKNDILSIQKEILRNAGSSKAFYLKFKKLQDPSICISSNSGSVVNSTDSNRHVSNDNADESNIDINKGYSRILNADAKEKIESFNLYIKTKSFTLEQLDINIVDLNLSTRTKNSLLKSNINTIFDLVNLIDNSDTGVGSIRGLGVRCITELEERLSRLGNNQA